ncbi:hypothetical protein [Dolichospermum circinale]|uniref:hypothetical protein n=1 Tax=Dolichospermum circinale TaxID=109265 RepID=UPI0004271149|nr:hypothetical protein [Dolichospermum circinale]MDB9475075.1 hypothetical protein [Dolichospermum circinale CS-537/11]MDB9480026.1 hypothetical protein [Dolichospermum circinale CS-537/03]MDB9482927.1 hypothetical protein [Dolichospermum circinale CS-537/05]
MIRTFIDAGVLIYAARSQGEIAEKALQILEDENREFASSIFLKLEVLPKAIYNHQKSEVKFYEAFFEKVSYWAKDINTIIAMDNRFNHYRCLNFYSNGLAFLR